jgi:hypothetical protein
VEDVAGGYSSLMALRYDGTVLSTYNGPFAPVQWPSGGTATGIAISAYANIENGCAILGGAVWCYPTPGTSSANSSFYLGGGISGATVVSAPVQVTTSVGVSPTVLSGAVQIAGATTTGTQAAFCAVTSDGSVWCWGRNSSGMLGHGDTSDSSYARQVMADASRPFAGAAEVTLGGNTGCARKSNGEVWCWGENGKGQCGTGSATPTTVSYPVKVTLASAATGLIRRAYDTFCAILGDTSVTCWGANGDAQAGAPASSGNVGPTKVLVAAGGAALQGVVSIAPDGTGLATCASTTGMGLVCWGNASASQGAARAPNPYPAVVYDPDTHAPVVGVGKALTGNASGNLVFLNPYGSLVNGSYGSGGAGLGAYGQQPSCN